MLSLNQLKKVQKSYWWKLLHTVLQYTKKFGACASVQATPLKRGPPGYMGKNHYLLIKNFQLVHLLIEYPYHTVNSQPAASHQVWSPFVRWKRGQPLIPLKNIRDWLKMSMRGLKYIGQYQTTYRGPHYKEEQECQQTLQISVLHIMVESMPDIFLGVIQKGESTTQY